MVVKKYPIGTKIRFLNRIMDTGKEGVIVGLTMNRGPDIYLPTAKKHLVDNYRPTLSDGTKFTWHCGWDEIEVLVVKCQQLLFPFMSEAT